MEEFLDLLKVILIGLGKLILWVLSWVLALLWNYAIGLSVKLMAWLMAIHLPEPKEVSLFFQSPLFLVEPTFGAWLIFVSVAIALAATLWAFLANMLESTRRQAVTISVLACLLLLSRYAVQHFGGGAAISVAVPICYALVVSLVFIRKATWREMAVRSRLTIAAIFGNKDAQYKLGMAYKDGPPIFRDRKKAAKWFFKAAKQGHVEAQYNLGKLNGWGNGLKASAEWYQAAAEQGHAGAQYELGYCYLHGIGVEMDRAKAGKWYRKAAEQGHEEAQNTLRKEFGVEDVEEEKALAERWSRLAVKGDADAQYELGECYYYGNGVEIADRSKAVEWYRKAADQGHEQAQYSLGFCYENGYGVEKDMDEAAEWYGKAAAQGHKFAQHQLGECYLDGRGVEKNLYEAAKWFRKSAEQGDAEAQRAFGECCEKGWGVTKDETLAVEWYRKAAKKGYSFAKCVLGRCYLQGVGVERDLTEAAYWLGEAIDDHGEASALAEEYMQKLKRMSKYS